MDVLASEDKKESSYRATFHSCNSIFKHEHATFYFTKHI